MEKQGHAVVMHSSGPEAGYVVRTAYLQADQTWWIPNPYGNAVPVRIFQRESAAQKLADKLNAQPRVTQQPEIMASW